MKILILFVIIVNNWHYILGYRTISNKRIEITICEIDNHDEIAIKLDEDTSYQFISILQIQALKYIKPIFLHGR